MPSSRPTAEPEYRRILLKLSGEAFRSGDAIFAQAKLEYIVREVSACREAGVELAIVVGGGNMIRGHEVAYLDRAMADRMGMLATLINGFALVQSLEKGSLRARLQSAVPCNWAESLDPRASRKALDAGEVVVFAGGTGNPFVTTDTAAAIRAAEIGADALLKGTQVDGIYSVDPNVEAEAERYHSLTFQRAIREELGVMDLAALALCRDRQIPVGVFRFADPGALLKMVMGQSVGSWVKD